MPRALRALLCLVPAALLLAAATTAHAAHVPPHSYSGTFAGSGTNAFTSPSTLVVDQATHTVYVADRFRFRVLKFDTQGNFILMFGDGVNKTTGGDVCTAASGDTCGEGNSGSQPDRFANITSMGIDNSGGPSAGSVYVGDRGNGRITKYTPDGVRALDFAGSGAMTNLPGGNFVSMTVDLDGSIWILDENNRFTKYDHRGIFDHVAPANGDSLGTSVSSAQMAIDSRHIIAFANGFGNGRKGYGDGINREESSLPQFTTGGSGFGINPENDDLYVSKGNRVSAYTKACDPALGECVPVETFGTGEISGAAGVGIDSLSSRVFVATSAGVAYFDALIAPDVLNSEPPTYTSDSATVHAEIDPAGGGDVISCEIEYGTTASYGSTAPCDQATPLSAATDVSGTLPGLSAETPYHYRFVAANANGATQGKDRVVTPHHVLSIATRPATGIGSGSATLNGEFDPDGEATHYFFEYGTSTAYGNVTSAPPGEGSESGTGVVDVSIGLDGILTGFTTYHFRLVATNGSGVSYGEDREFTTEVPMAPTVESSSSSGVLPRSATLHAAIRAGFGPTAYRFQYGRSPSYEFTTVFGPSIGNDNTTHAVSDLITDLDPGTTYHYRVIAINFGGTTKSPDQTFTTPDRPALGSVSVEVTSPTTAVLRTTVMPNLGATTVRFGYGNASPAESGTPTIAVDALDMVEHPVTTTISGLSPNTPYLAQAAAANPFGDVQSSVVSFRTPALPSVAEPPRPGTKPCKRGFVKKHGKCVKKKQRKKKQRKSHRRGGR